MIVSLEANTRKLSSPDTQTNKNTIQIPTYPTNDKNYKSYLGWRYIYFYKYMLLKKTYLNTTFKDVHHDFLHLTFNYLFKRDLSYFHRNYGNGETYINISPFCKKN